MSSRFFRLTARLFATASLVLVAAGAANAQSTSPVGGASTARLEQERKGQTAEARHKKMENDAQRLVDMAQQLKMSVDKTNKNVLSLDVIKDAERIEKLAREVRDGMRP